MCARVRMRVGRDVPAAKFKPSSSLLSTLFGLLLLVLLLLLFELLLVFALLFALTAEAEGDCAVTLLLLVAESPVFFLRLGGMMLWCGEWWCFLIPRNTARSRQFGPGRPKKIVGDKLLSGIPT